MADEPTGALDSKASDALLKLFGDFNEEGQTILMVTHSTKAASCANRIMFIKDGEVFNQIYRGSMDNAREVPEDFGHSDRNGNGEVQSNE